MNRLNSFNKIFPRKFASTLTVLFVLSASVQPSPAEQPTSDITGVTQTLLSLIERQDKTTITAEDYESTSLRQLITLGTPAGYRIKLRYREFGISLVEALKAARDPEIRKRLIEQAQWAKRPRARAEAIITLAGLYDPLHKKYIKEALLDSNIGIRFAAVEALQQWRQPEAIPLLKMAMGRDWSPLMRIFSAQALLSLGDESGMAILIQGLDSESWVVRAMAARYFGDYAKPDEYQKLVSRLNRENKNNFVAAELALSALKLISKKGDKVTYSPSAAGWRENEEVRYEVGKGNVIELEPLIIVPPRLRIPASLRMASEINQRLLNLMKDHLGDEDPALSQDPVLGDLHSMVTPTGFGLMTRYSELSYLVIEGLAGTSDPLLRMELQRLATDASNPLVRASALISLAYAKDESDVYLIQNALNDKNAIVRFGAMEAIEVGRFRSALPSLSGLANSDASPALRVYAMQVLARFGDPSGRLLLLASLDEPDWPARAMAYWYLGKYGDSNDYSAVLARLPVERNPFVQCEIALGVLRLAPVGDQ